MLTEDSAIKVILLLELYSLFSQARVYHRQEAFFFDSFLVDIIQSG